MKTKILILAALGFFTTTLFTSCDTSQDKVENVKEELKDEQDEVGSVEEDLQEAKNEYLIEVSNFKKEAEVKIAENKKTIEVLKEKKSLKKDIYDEKIAELERRNDVLRDKLRDYKEEIRSEKWEAFKRDFNDDMNSLGKSIKNAFNNNEN